uniref:DDE_Tnp_1_7 domain-containing protein n=1 Tax=Rhabditophanes sp. KR3021 TaxID=114890 RepID=A0AC35UGW7_9BILA
MFYTNNEESYYEDSYVTLTENYLIIKRYFFPSRKNKIVPIDAIKVVNYEPQTNQMFGSRKLWGPSGTDVYWAFDVKRCLPGNKEKKSDVIVDIEDGLRKGFTIENTDLFIKTLRNVCHFNLIIADNLNV